MTKEFVIGLDIGTTSVKAVLFNLIGEVAGENEKTNTFYYPSPGRVEQDALQIEISAITVIRQVIEQNGIDKKQIHCVGISCAMHSLLCVDEQGSPLSPVILWTDIRAQQQATELEPMKGTEIYHRTGTPIHPMSPFIKLLWMKNSDYEPYKKASYFISIKEFLIMRWFGKKIIDYSIASATGMFDLYSLHWNEEALHIAGISEKQLFSPVAPTQILTDISRQIAQEMKIEPNTPFVLGASDGPLANLGIGAIDPGEAAITIGTSGAIRQFTSTPYTDLQRRTFCYTFTKDLVILGGATNNGGNVLQWIRDFIVPKESYEAFISLANTIKPGADGILFLPYLNGERAPLWNANARGNLFGLTTTHSKAHILRAVIEGIIFNIYHISQTVEQIAGEAKQLYATGGFARSSVGLQIIADIYNKEVKVPLTHQSSAWGAAWLALYSIGQVPDLKSIKQSIPMKESIQPNPDNHQVYKEIYVHYMELLECINPIFRRKAT